MSSDSNVLQSAAQRSKVEDRSADSVKSGESAFKVYSFDQKHKDRKNYQKCKDFWEFIDSRPDLKPIRGFKMEQQKTPKKEASEMGDCEKKTSWTDVLQLLVEKGLTKAARVANSSNQCKMCRMTKCEGYKEPEDTFDVKDLNDFDPQRKILVDEEVQTDTIQTIDAETQTDIKEDWEIVIEERKKKLEELSAIMETIKGEKEQHSTKCTCDDCKCQPSNSQQNKCTCSCGESKCRCSECSKILAEIERTSVALDAMDEDVVTRCGCSDKVRACLLDFSRCIQAKLHYNQLARTEWCTCGQRGCPCDFLVGLVHALDVIFAMAVGNAEEACSDFYSKILDEAEAVDSEVSMEIGEEVLCSPEEDEASAQGRLFTLVDGNVPSGILPSVNWGISGQTE